MNREHVLLGTVFGRMVVFFLLKFYCFIIFFIKNKTYSLKCIKVQVKSEKSFPNLQNLIKNRARETHSNRHQNGIVGDNILTRHSLGVCANSYKKFPWHCSSICYFNSFDLHIKI